VKTMKDFMLLTDDEQAMMEVLAKKIHAMIDSDLFYIDTVQKYPNVLPIPGSKNKKVTNRRRLLLQKPAEAAASFFVLKKSESSDSSGTEICPKTKFANGFFVCMRTKQAGFRYTL